MRLISASLHLATGHNNKATARSTASHPCVPAPLPAQHPPQQHPHQLPAACP